MQIQNLIWILCLVGIVTCLSVENFKESSIDQSASVGESPRIDKNVVIKSKAKIGDYVRINRDTYIGKKVQVGSYSKIGEFCTLEKEVIVKDYVRIDDGCIIEAESIIENHGRVSSNVRIGYRTTINEYSKIDKDSNLGDNSVLDRYAKVGAKVKLQAKAYIGSYCKIGDKAVIGESAAIDSYSKIGFKSNVQKKAYVGKNCTIGELVTIDENAVVHKNVQIRNGNTIGKSEVVMEPPSSLDFYQLCADTVSDEQAEIATPSENGTISAEFNELMKNLIDDEMNALNRTCSNCKRKPKKNVTRPKTLPQIISLYLIQYHGLEKFKSYVQQAKYEQFDITLRQRLSGEIHFVINGEKNVLLSEIRKRLILLLAIDQDAERPYRVKDDTFCKMIDQLSDGTRKLSLSERV